MTSTEQPSRQIGVGGLKISERAKALVNEALDTNRLSIGRFVHTFESRFAELHDCRFGVMANSGTSALQIALGALKEMHGWQDEDEVIVPALTFIATSNVVLYNGLRPVFADVDPHTYNLDPAAVRSALTDRTRAIMPVHLFGLPCDMDPIMDFAASQNLSVVEDSCETMFARYRGRRVGSFGDAGCFSTYVAHILVTGVGGLVTTDDETLSTLCRSLLAHGRDSIYLDIDQDDGLSDNELRQIIERRFSFVRLGHSFRPTELEGALGLAQIEEGEEIVRTRRRNAMHLTSRLRRFDSILQLPHIPDDRDHAFMMYPIVLRSDGVRHHMVSFLEENGIETRFTFPLLTQPVYRKLFNANMDNYPHAAHIGSNGFYVGCHQELDEEDMEYIAATIERFLGSESGPTVIPAADIAKTAVASEAATTHK